MRLTASSFACSFVGLKFWRVNSRKFYAVPEEDLLAPCRKKSRSAVQTVDLTDESCNCTEAVRDLAHSVDLLTKKVDRIFELTKDTAVPLGLRDLLDDHLKCKICHASPMTPPIIMAKCCRSIIGCESCVNRWYAGENTLTKLCPSCKAERGYAETLRLHGLDDLLTGIVDALQ